MSRQRTGQIKAIVASNIRLAREEAGLTQRQLAAQVNDMEAMAVSRWERAQVLPSTSSLVALAAALNREIAWFYEDRDEEKAA